jgi:hypothetical protein
VKFGLILDAIRFSNLGFTLLKSTVKSFYGDLRFLNLILHSVRAKELVSLKKVDVNERSSARAVLLSSL